MNNSPEQNKKIKLYRAIIWTSDSEPGQRVTVLGVGLQEARAKLEAEYGEGNVFNLFNDEDAAKPR